MSPSMTCESGGARTMRSAPSLLLTILRPSGVASVNELRSAPNVVVVAPLLVKVSHGMVSIWSPEKFIRSRRARPALGSRAERLMSALAAKLPTTGVIESGVLSCAASPPASAAAPAAGAAGISSPSPPMWSTTGSRSAAA